MCTVWGMRCCWMSARMRSVEVRLLRTKGSACGAPICACSITTASAPSKCRSQSPGSARSARLGDDVRVHAAQDLQVGGVLVEHDEVGIAMELEVRDEVLADEAGAAGQDDLGGVLLHGRGGCIGVGKAWKDGAMSGGRHGRRQHQRGRAGRAGRLQRDGGGNCPDAGTCR